MKNRGQATLLAFSILVPAVLFGQGGQNLSITNVQVVSLQVTAVRTNVTYRADLVNPGEALGSVTATLTSLNPFSFKVVPGQDTLTFAPVPAKSQVTSNNTVTILVDPRTPFDFANLQWSFQTTPAGPIANAGPHQSVKAGDTVILDGSGSTNPVAGTLTYKWAFTIRPGGSAAQLSDPNSVRPSFVADVPGDYVLMLTVSNGMASSSSSVTISTVYTPPVARAGPNQTVVVGSTVVLNGSASTDVNGAPLTYQWSLTSVPTGSTATLSGANTVSPTFVMDKAGTYVARLVVNDGTSNSDPATVTITTLNSPPVANAGSNKVVAVGAPVQLNGSGSTDVDGDPLTYKWSLISMPTGSKAALSDPAAVNPTFTADLSGTYVAQLTVNDGKVDSKPVTVMFTTNTVLAPVATAGPDQTVVHRTTVLLNGSGTDPQALPLTFQWALLTKPTGSNATLLNANLANASFFVDLPGTYVAQLIASNGYLNSAPATVTITTTNTPPVANAGPNQNVLTGASVKLDASGSFDADRDPLTYTWALLSRPDGSNATLSDINSVAPTFTADVAGTYVAQLIVNDGFSNSLTPSTVTVTAVKTTAIALAPNPLNFSTASAGVLTLTLAAPAGPGGQVVNLTSFNPSIAAVPSTVTVPEGATSATVTVSPGNIPGSTAVFATAPGFLPRFVTANVVAATITLTTDTGTVGLTRTMNGSITLSMPAPAGGLTVTLSTAAPGILDVEPASITIQGGSTTGTFTVTGLALGSAAITANSPGFTPGVANVTVGLLGFVALPAFMSVGLNQFVPFPVNLATPAPTGGVSITLTSDDSSKAVVTPSIIFIPFKATAPATQPVLFGINLGSTNIRASAPGFTIGDPTLVQITGTINFSPPALIMNGSTTQNVTLTLSGPAPLTGLTVNLRSDNVGVATVPPTVTFPPFGTMVTVPVTSIGTGLTSIHASSLPNVPDAAITVTVQ